MVIRSWCALASFLGAYGFSTNVVLDGMPEMAPGDHPITVDICGPDSAQPTTYPLFVFVHAVGLTADNYESLCAPGGVASRGYVVARVATYNQFQTFSTDFAGVGHDVHLASKCLVGQSKTNSSSPVYGLLSGRVVQAGHSAGADVVLLEAAGLLTDPYEDSEIPTALSAWAPGYPAFGTDVLGAAEAIDVPALLLVGSKDCNPALNTSAAHTQFPLFQKMTTKCKALVVLSNGGHCGFATATEDQCPLDSPCVTLSPTDQQHVAIELTTQFFDSTVRNAGFGKFKSLLEAGERSGKYQYAYKCHEQNVPYTTSFSFDLSDTCDDCSSYEPLNQAVGTIIASAAGSGAAGSGSENLLEVDMILEEDEEHSPIFGFELNRH